MVTKFLQGAQLGLDRIELRSRGLAIESNQHLLLRFCLGAHALKKIHRVYFVNFVKNGKLVKSEVAQAGSFALLPAMNRDSFMPLRN